MSELKLQPDELELLASYENDEWQSARRLGQRQVVASEHKSL